MRSSTTLLRTWCVFVFAAILNLASSPARASDDPYIVACDGTDIADTLQEAIYDRVHPYILLTNSNGGDCMISKTIKIANRTGLRIEGGGRNKTILRWNSTGGPMFLLLNSSGISFAHFGVKTDRGDAGNAGTELVSAFDMYNSCFDGLIDTGQVQEDLCSGYSPGDPPGSWGNSLEDIAIQQGNGSNPLLNGVRVLLHPDYQPLVADLCQIDVRADCGNGGHVFDHVHIYNFHKSAFVLEGKASVGNVFRDTHCRGTFLGSSLMGDPPTIDPDCCGNSCVYSGREEYPDTAASFAWYGGLANAVADSAFVIGADVNKVHISGTYAERCHRLLRTTTDFGSDATTMVPVDDLGLGSSIAGTEDVATGSFPNTSDDTAGLSAGIGDVTPVSIAHFIPTSGGITIESTFFDSQWMNDWEGVAADYGAVVDARNVRSLSMRGNTIGFRGEGNYYADWMALCWSPREGDDAGSFVFEGNAIGTKFDNPFRPWNGSEYMEGCVYPTIQRDNLWAPRTAWDPAVPDDPDTIPGVHDSWIPMPTHFSVVNTTTSSSFSVFDTPGDHQVFVVEGLGSVECIEGGAEGQKIVLMKPLQGGLNLPSTTIEQATNPGTWPILGCRNIRLNGSQALQLGPTDTLTLVKGDDGVWYEIARSDN